MAARRQTIRPTPVVLAVLAAIAGGAAYGGLTALVPAIKLNAGLFTIAVMGGYLTHAGLQRGLFTNLGVSLISGALAITAMWAAWIAAEYSPQQALWLVQQGPVGAYGYLATLASRTTLVVHNGAAQDWTQGPEMVRWFWLGDTLALGLAPVLGALYSPLARRRMQTLA